MKCAIVGPVTKYIYSKENSKLLSYKKYKTQYTEINNESRNVRNDILAFTLFLQLQYKCLCIVSPPENITHDFLIILNSKINYEYPPSIQHLFELSKRNPDPHVLSDFKRKYNDKFKRLRFKEPGEIYHILFIEKENFELIKKCKKKYMSIPCIIQTQDELGEYMVHANSIIFDIKNKKMIRFEPHGKVSLSYNNIKLNKIMKYFTKIIGYKHYVPPIDFCPLELQYYEQNTEYDAEGGFCLMFSYLFICYVLDYPDNSLHEIIRKMFLGENKNLMNTPPNPKKVISREIRLFTNFYIDTIKQVMPDLIDILIANLPIEQPEW